MGTVRVPGKGEVQFMRPGGQKGSAEDLAIFFAIFWCCLFFVWKGL